MPEVPERVEVATTDLIDLAVEAWRLQGWLDRNATAAPGALAAVRHVSRNLQNFLRSLQIQVTDLTEQPYDPGLAVAVVDTEEAQGTAGGPVIITEMVTPIVTCRGNVVRSGQVVTGRRAENGREPTQ